ncbi:MAG: hypothetical protein AB1444_04480 [Spirochaetota bacterium]
MNRNIFILAGLSLLVIIVLYADDFLTIKSGCIQATINAITWELENYQNKHTVAEEKGDMVSAQKMAKRILQCQEELKRIKAITPDKYILLDTESQNGNQLLFEKDKIFGMLMPPLVKHVTITLKEKCEEKKLLYIDGITRSGPFYHVAGIVDNYENLKVGKRYRLTIYLVYKKEYFGFIPNYYVYISHYEAM